MEHIHTWELDVDLYELEKGLRGKLGKVGEDTIYLDVYCSCGKAGTATFLLQKVEENE